MSLREWAQSIEAAEADREAAHARIKQLEKELKKSEDRRSLLENENRAFEEARRRNNWTLGPLQESWCQRGLVKIEWLRGRRRTTTEFVEKVVKDPETGKKKKIRERVSKHVETPMVKLRVKGRPWVQRPTVREALEEAMERFPLR